MKKQLFIENPNRFLFKKFLELFHIEYVLNSINTLVETRKCHIFNSRSNARPKRDYDLKNKYRYVNMYIQLQSVSFNKIHVSSLNKVFLDKCADIRKVD